MPDKYPSILIKAGSDYLSKHGHLDVVNDILSLAQKDPEVGVELCGYTPGSEFTPEQVAQIRTIPSYKKVYHLTHRLRVRAVVGETALAQIEDELIEMAKLGIRTGILHFQCHNHVPLAMAATTMEYQLAALNALATKHGVILYLENVAEDTQFVLGYFLCCETLGFKNLGFCFDWGHAAVFNVHREPLHHWLPLFRSLSDAKFPLHFHIHGNRGGHDDHMNFMELDQEGLFLKKTEFAIHGLEVAFQDWFNTFGKKHTITFESFSGNALANLQFVRNLGLI